MSRRDENKDPLRDYVPPQDVQAEQSTLGAMLIEAPAVEKARALLTAADFYRDAHGLIFDIICDLTDRAVECDFITVSAELRDRDQYDQIGGETYLMALLDTVPTAANVEFYARIVREKSHRRRAIAEAFNVIRQARDEDSDLTAALDASQTRLARITEGATDALSEPLGCVISDLSDEIDRRAENPGVPTGLTTGIPRWDAMTGGLQPSDLIILAGRPSMGKTSMALTVAERAAIDGGVPVMVFSLEMSKPSLARRIVCSRAEVASQKLRGADLTQDEHQRVSQVFAHFYRAPIRICDQTNLTPAMIRAECRRAAREEGLGLIIVDYLQLMAAGRKTENRTQEISEITRALKNIAREFNAPVLALSQLSRAVESRQDKRPMLSDLRESGQIEAEADMVCFLYREAYYQQKAEGGAAGSDPTVEQAELIISKQRNGPTGFIPVGFVPQFARYEEWTPSGY